MKHIPTQARYRPGAVVRLGTSKFVCFPGSVWGSSTLVSPFQQAVVLDGRPAGDGAWRAQIHFPSLGTVTTDDSYALQLVHLAPTGDVLAAFEAYVLAGEDAAAARFILDIWKGTCG